MKHIPHLYLAGGLSNESVTVSETQRNHLTRVLRLGPGADVTYTDGHGTVGEGVWTGSKVERGAESTRPRTGGPVLAVAPPAKRDRSRFLVEKLAELGVESLVWMRTERGSARIPSRDKQDAWTAAALEQSRGAWLMSTSDTLVGLADLEPPLVVCSPGGIEPGPGLQPQTIAIGPEGGLSANEIPSHAMQVTLAKTILRIETAAIVAAIIFR